MSEQQISERSRRFYSRMEAELSSGDFDFPTSMELCVRIKRVLDDPLSGIDEVSRLISVEPLLAAHVVRLANSAMYRRGDRPIADVRNAVLLVGTAAIRPMALALVARQITQSVDARVRVEANQLWRHTIEVAALTWAIAADVPGVSPDQALYAGLVHKLGSFYLLARVSDFPELIAEEGELADLIRYWNPRISRDVLIALGTPEGVADAVEEAELYFEGWPPRSLSDVLYIGVVSAETPDPFEDLGGISRDALTDEALGRIDAEQLQAMLSRASARHAEALATLRG
ncbi:MAG: HDOD domain-containing protein [Rhodocyclaceae bacterium]|nr:HDOD domain-containing protein [Rhodocyclaceae bacterium]